jgi:SAM-dependent methyltransferase
MSGADYTGVTEAPGDQLRREALDMLWTRYQWAAEQCDGRSVLEVGCGAGQGLGILTRRAARVVGGDYTDRLLRMARSHYGSRVPLVRLDAHHLPFGEATFDVILLYESIYYLADPCRFLQECRRLLRDRGTVLICTVNRLVRAFNPSPHSVRYLCAEELQSLLVAHGFQSEILGAFSDEGESWRGRAVALIKQLAVSLHLIPKTMKGKAWLKRLFFGPLATSPAELREGMATYHPPARLREPSGREYRVLFARGQRA